MKPLAARTAGLRQSDIRAVTLAVNRVGGINLGQGICDLATPDPVKRGAVAAVEANQSIYTAYNGIAPLRAAIAEQARAFNRLPLESPDEVMVSVGSTGAFVAAALTLCDPGDEVILFEPFYGYHSGLLNLLGVRPVFVPLSQPGWGVDFEALEAAITPRTKAILVCTPANPCGKVWTVDELTRLLGLLEAHDLWAITDEIYEHMVYDGRVHVSLGSLPGAYPRTITLSGYSKTLNMTGWRLGYAIAAPPVIEQMGLISDLVYICAPAPLQYGVAAALPLGDDYYTDLHEDYVTRRTLMGETLEACGFSAAYPEGAYYSFASFAGIAGTRPGFDDDRMACDTLIQQAGVATVPGSAFFSDPARGRHYLRFCFAKDLPVLEDACARLRRTFGA